MTQFFAKKLNKKGFTLAELLIVVAIIAILVAVALPIFTNALDAARIAVHQSNARAIKAMAVTELLAPSAGNKVNMTSWVEKLAEDKEIIAYGTVDDKGVITLFAYDEKEAVSSLTGAVSAMVVAVENAATAPTSTSFETKSADVANAGGIDVHQNLAYAVRITETEVKSISSTAD